MLIDISTEQCNTLYEGCRYLLKGVNVLDDTNDKSMNILCIQQMLTNKIKDNGDDYVLYIIKNITDLSDKSYKCDKDCVTRDSCCILEGNGYWQLNIECIIYLQITKLSIINCTI